MRAVDERIPLLSLWTTPTPPRLEKVMVPLEVMPVAAAMLPAELTWNWELAPTENKDAGAVVPMPTFPPTAVRAVTPAETSETLPVLAVPSVSDCPLVVPIVPFASNESALPLERAEMDAVGVPLALLTKANFALVVELPPSKRSLDG